MPIISPTAISPHRMGGKSWSSYWSTHTDPYSKVYQAMPTKPSVEDGLIQQEALNALIDGGYFAKAELIDIFSTHSQDTACINWKSPGTYNPSEVNSPTWEQYKGYTGNKTTTKYIRSNFIPSTHGTLIATNSMTAIIGVGSDLDENSYDFGVYDGNTSLRFYARSGNNMAMWLNSDGANNIANTSSVGHYAGARTNNTSYLHNKNMITSATAQNNSAETLVSKEIYICGRNNNGTPEGCGRQIRYFMLFSYLTEYEANDVIRIMETYLRNYSAGLFTDKKVLADVSSDAAHPLTTFVGYENETIHPSVLDIGSAWHGYRYWQANTPFPIIHYPEGYTLYEVPCIWASIDGTTWVVPPGLTNPIQPTEAGKFYPDPNIYYENSELYCFYMATSGIVYRKSSDGITWGNKTEITMDETPDRCPSAIKIGEYYYLYYQMGESSPYEIHRSKCSTLTGSYDDEETIVFTGAAINPWHFEIREIDSVLWMLIHDANGFIYAAYSTDGINFAVTNNKEIFRYSWVSADSLYKPSIVKIGNTVKMYYTHRVTGVGNLLHSVTLKII